MKIISKYIFKELVKSFLISFLIFTFILLLNNIFQLINLFINKSTNIVLTVKLLFYLILTLFTLTVPISILFSIIFTYSKMNEDNELLVLKTFGKKSRIFLWQPLITGIFLTVLLCWMNLNVSPIIQQQFQKIYRQLFVKTSQLKFEPKKFINIGDHRIYVNKLKNNVLYGVNIYKPFELSIFSKKAITKKNEKGIEFNLFDGIIQYYSQDLFKVTQFKFDSYKIFIQLQEQSLSSLPSKSLREFTAKELLNEIENYKKQGLNTCFLETEYFLRWTISFASITFVISGLIYVTKIKHSKFFGLGLAVIMIGIYYFVLISSITLAEKSIITPKYILWLPNIILLLISFIYYNVNKNQ